MNVMIIDEVVDDRAFMNVKRRVYVG